jgi:hypothetical protein
MAVALLCIEAVKKRLLLLDHQTILFAVRRSCELAVELQA